MDDVSEFRTELKGAKRRLKTGTRAVTHSKWTPLKLNDLAESLGYGPVIRVVYGRDGSIDFRVHHPDRDPDDAIQFLVHPTSAGYGGLTRYDEIHPGLIDDAVDHIDAWLLAIEVAPSAIATERTPDAPIANGKVGRKRDPKIKQRNNRLRELSKEHGATGAKLRELASEDPQIEAIGLAVTLDVARNAIKPPKKRGKK